MKSGLKSVLSRVRQRITHAWSRPVLRRIIFVGILVLCFVIGFQLFYPSNRTLPNASIDGLSVGSKNQEELAPLLLTHFDDTKVTVQAATQTATQPLSDFGATLNVDRAVAQLTSYPWWQRLLPFSFVLKHQQVKSLPIDFDEKRFALATEALATKLHTEPQNGAVAVDDAGAVTVSAAKDGVSVTAKDIRESVQAAKLRFGGNTVVVEANITPPSVTNDMVSGITARLTSLLKTKLVIQNSLDMSKSYTPEPKTLASWIVIGEKLALSIDREALAGYANEVAKNYLVPAGTTTVVVIDGVETSRTIGLAGRGVDIDSLILGVTKALLEEGDKTLPMGFLSLPPNVVYQRNYSSSQAALQVYLDDVAKGSNIQIAVRQLNGPGWTASTNGAKSVVAASTYKLFVSTMLFDKINTGQTSWTNPIQGTDVSTCLRNMIVVSANNCAEQWISEWGRPNINSFLYGKGFSSATTFMASDATHTSANDLQKLLVGLQGRTLFNESDATRLTDYMKQQVYRKGIPAGSAGVVADKVGFLWDYLNDAAIVYHPRGTYVLVVMTQGQSWGKIAEITRQVEKILYP